MAGFMLRAPGGDNWMVSPPDGREPAEILLQLTDSLRALDRLGAGLAAIHLATAIEQFCAQFGLDEDQTDLD